MLFNRIDRKKSCFVKFNPVAPLGKYSHPGASAFFDVTRRLSPLLVGQLYVSGCYVMCICLTVR